jgi:tetraacyldisaccharide 4'-kinase
MYRMKSPPQFWSKPGAIGWALSPLSVIGSTLTARRVARPGWRAPIPVLCCGNATVGGSGKTPLVLDLAQRLAGRNPHILLRGYKGKATGAHRVRPDDPVSLVGDEALLLAATAPTWVGADRAKSAMAANQAGAKILLMDDGLQNPTLAKTASFLVVDGRTGFGNGRVLPAGPLREPVHAAASRCQAVVLIGQDQTNALSQLPPGLPVFHAELIHHDDVARLIGSNVVAFAGIGSPDKFFASLQRLGIVLTKTCPFPDHHFYSAKELCQLGSYADRHRAILVTTSKDAVRLPQDFRSKVVAAGVRLTWQKPEAFDEFVNKIIAQD